MKFEDKLSQLQDIFCSVLEPLLQGYKEYTFFDFPDYPNVGDSLIFRGEKDYFDSKGLVANGINSMASPLIGISKHSELVIFQGGGNLAGLYPTFDQYRFLVLDHLARGTKVLMMPQSMAKYSFVDLEPYREFSKRLEIIFLARDNETLDYLKTAGLVAKLAPDAAHMAGMLAAPEEIQENLILARTDNETRDLGSQVGSVDWLGESRFDRAAQSIRNLARYSDRLGVLLNLGSEKFEALADKRIERGIKLLSKGATVVTDRLHAMILGLQIRRNVIAIDNKNKKLTRYIDCWGLADCEELVVAQTFPNYK